MKTLLLSLKFLVVLSLYCGVAEAQAPQWAWTKSFGGSGDESVTKVVADSRGEVYAYGYFNSASLSVGPTTHVNAGGNDVILIKLDTVGHIEWSKSFGGNGQDSTGSMVTDHDGNVLISGIFQNSITIGSTTLTSLGSHDIFVAKLNTNGNVIWVKQIGGTGLDIAYALNCDVDNNVYLTGTYTANISVAGMALPAMAANNLFYGKLTSSGDPVWAKKTGNADGCYILDLKFLMADKIVFAGHTYASITFDPAGIAAPVAGGDFYLKLDTAGNFYSQKFASPVTNINETPVVAQLAISPDKKLFTIGRSSYFSLAFGLVIKGMLKLVDTSDQFNDIVNHTTLPVSPLYPGPQFLSTSIGRDVLVTKDGRTFSLGNSFGGVNFDNGYSYPSSQYDYQSSFIWETNNALTTTGLLNTTPELRPVILGSITNDTLTNSLYTAGYFITAADQPKIIIGEDTISSVGGLDLVINKISINGYLPIRNPIVDIGRDTVICVGSSVEIGTPSAIYGTQPYTYSWSPTTGLSTSTESITIATPSITTDYILTVIDANGRIASDNIHVGVLPIPALPVITAGGSLNFCAGGSVTLTASAGHHYIWSNGATTQSITVNTTGTYSVKDSSDAGCVSAVASVAVTVNPIPATPVITSGPLTFCAGSFTTLITTGGDTYIWSNGATTASIIVNASGSYTVKTHALGCESLASAPVVVVANPLPAAPTISQAGNVLSSSAATGNQWYYNTSIIPGATGSQYTYTNPGTYTVTVTDANGCGASSTDHSASFTTGQVTILRNGDPFLHFISPNPMQPNSSVNFNLRSAADMSIVIVGDNGIKAVELLRNQHMAAGDYRIPISNNIYKLKNGVYYITYFVNSEKVVDRVVVIK